MNKEELQARIRKELKMPYFKAQVSDDIDFTEDEYQEFKNNLISYYKDYVQDIDIDFQGGLEG
ncbi:hypothetical protein BG261_06155 [Floricoccus tropicus]|uniref:Uncharacterized protein n=1 Tax=Floricoccus tropicus TaxID=1859473 RepID=A0A1E8GJQ7_9LACT|nr:hypothetical protein [Floricoccus tropicus]OFI48484.1 hypothetical protein BG261_06155 [Floricoccus tropicus]